MLKEILQFSLVVALVGAGNSGVEVEKSGGFNMDSKEVFYWCTAGTPLGERLEGAWDSCFNAVEEQKPAGKKECFGKKCKGERRGKRAAYVYCPSLDLVEAWFNKDFQGENLSSLLPVTPALTRPALCLLSAGLAGQLWQVD